MRVAEITNAAELDAIRPEWNALLATSSSNTIFLTWEWISTWWQAYGEPGELYVLTAVDENGILRGIAPLRHKTMQQYGRKAAMLAFAGDGSNDSDYLDFIIAAGYEERVMRAFEQHWKQGAKDTILGLNEIPETSPNLSFLQQIAEQPGIVSVETSVPCGTVLLPGTWEEYLSSLKPRFRTKIRSVLRNLESRTEVSFGFCNDASEAESLLPILFDLHTKRWNEDGKPGVFHWNRKQVFYHQLSAVLLERGWLRFSWLKWKGQVLACQYGFLYNNVYFHLQEGYEPSAEHWNLGLGLRAWCFREFLKEGVREYDFLGGIGRHKTDWGADTKLSRNLRFATGSWKNHLLCQGPAWEARARESVGKMLPESVHKLRRALLNGKSVSPDGSAPDGSIRHTIAKCYFHLGGPALSRSIRQHYQVAASHGWPGRVLRKRTEPVARILCYHRINDDNDPFFPATSTRVFEEQMEFISKNYKVVNLSNLLSGLENNSPETFVAITFDDGYQDNYLNALPILERYGLPATVFLTTGSIDYRESMWFEQLAEAVKKTEREWIDLELDIPRRFGFRDQAQRLESNNRLFGLLRVLGDGERRRWLKHILQELGFRGGFERSNQMLTWDQIRAMKARRIDFGGHTVNHPFVSKLTQDQALWEVSECKRRIESELQSPADHFAYPNGREPDFSEWNKDILRSAGYRSAVTTIWGVNYRSTDRMELRRGGPWEESTAMFAYKLDWYQLTNE